MDQAELSAENTPGQLMALLLARFLWFDGGLQASLDAAGWGGVRRLESMAMIHVHAGIRRPSDLARVIGVTRQSINTALRELEEKGLVRLVPDPEDRRCKIVEFAPEGAGMREAALTAVTSLEALLAERLGSDRVAALVQLLEADWGAPTGQEGAAKRASEEAFVV